MESFRRSINAQFSSFDSFDCIAIGCCVGITGYIVLQNISDCLNSDVPVKIRVIRTSLSLAKRFIPGVQAKVDAEQEKFLTSVRHSLERHDNNRNLTLPEHGISHAELFQLLKTFKEGEEKVWKSGKVSGGIYHGGDEHVRFVNEVFSMFSISNPLHSDLFPSLRKFEAEIVRMTADMLHGDSKCCGSVTSGGTESILSAIKCYRDKARAERGVTRPELITPVTAHAAFDKACQYFNIRQVKIPVGEDFKVDMARLRAAINRNTIAIVGSAPQFPHGIIDPIEELSKLAVEHNIGLHVDCCLGGFFLPWAKQLGYAIPEFDFALPGVTSISADTHKYGFGIKGTSVVVFRDKMLRRYLFFATASWPGGLYASPTMAGSRPGGLIASCWAGLVTLGKDGFRKEIGEIMKAQKRLLAELPKIENLEIMGEPLAMIIAVRPKPANAFNIHLVLDLMAKRGWNLNGLHLPPSIHIALTRLHTPISVQDQFLKDLSESVAEAKEKAKSGDKLSGGMAPIYGTASSVPDPQLIEESMSAYLELTMDPEL